MGYLLKDNRVSGGKLKVCLFVLIFSLFALRLSPFSFAQEPTLKELELRLQVVQAQKQIAASDFERGQLLIQNAQMRFKALGGEEEALTAKIEALKKNSEEKK